MHGRAIDETSEGADRRRGPMRPEQLLSVRQRQSRRLAGHRFRAVDTLFIIGTSVLVLHRSLEGPVIEAPVVDVVPVAAGAWVTWWLLGLMGLYRFGRSQRLAAHVGAVCAAAVAGGAIALIARWTLPAQIATSDVLASTCVTGAGLLVLHATWSGFVGRWRSQGWLTPNLIVVGATPYADDLIEAALERRDMNVLGIVDDRRDRSPSSLRGVPVLGDTDALLHHRVMPFVDLIVVTIDPTSGARVSDIIHRLSVLPNKITLLFDDASTKRRSAAIDELADAPLLPLHGETDAARKAFAKRIQDIAISVPALIAMLPLLVVIGLAIRLDSPGPILFRQRRHGFNNEEIVVWKFRTMRHEAADLRAERQVTAGDDRVTRVGRLLRATSLDELPQLLNVFKGEMSLVGPRPHAIGMKTGDVESAQLVAEYAHRHRIKPGMTGWAAINGSRGPLHDPNEVTRRVALDVDYIEHQTFWLDLKIMARTIPGLFGDRTAIR